MEPEYPLTSLPTMAATRKLTQKNRCISSTCLVPVRHQVFGKKISNTYDDYDSDSDIQNMIIDNDDHDNHGNHYGVEHHAHDAHHDPKYNTCPTTNLANHFEIDSNKIQNFDISSFNDNQDDYTNYIINCTESQVEDWKKCIIASGLDLTLFTFNIN